MTMLFELDERHKPWCKVCGKSSEKFSFEKKNNEYLWQCHCGEEYDFEKGYLFFHYEGNDRVLWFKKDFFSKLRAY